MKIFLILVLLLTFTSEEVNGQAILKNSGDITGFTKIPEETVFVHFNSPLLLAGEYLFYKMYCLNSKTNRLSSLSKIGYIELIDKDLKLIFKQKIILDKGQGNGDFFIPVNVPTGNYKILAYTNWMRNGACNTFFENEINIINPYQTNQLAHHIKDADKINDADSIITDKKDFSNYFVNVNNENSTLNLSLKKQNFKTRAKVSMVLKGVNSKKISRGDYSISVRKKGNIPEPIKISAVSFIENDKQEHKNKIPSIDSAIYLPELRGELISGRITTLNKGVEVKNLKVALSIPGENYYFQIVQTNHLGDFYINIDKDYSGNNAILQVLAQNRNEFKVNLNEHTSINCSNLVFTDFSLYPEMEEEILQRSIHNQIESAYFEFKPDSLPPTTPIQFFDSKKVQPYELNDFTRFNTVKETVLEVIKDVWVNKTSKGNFVFEIQSFDFSTKTGISPLILVDGIIIQDHTALIDYDARNIRKITVVRDQLVFGPKIYQGALIFETINGVYDQFSADQSLLRSSIFKPQPSKNYFSQRYDDSQKDKFNSRIPDDRLQLLWFPKIILTNNETAVDFFTSDVVGEFEISVEGFTKDGIPVSLIESIYVD